MKHTPTATVPQYRRPVTLATAHTDAQAQNTMPANE